MTPSFRAVLTSDDRENVGRVYRPMAICAETSDERGGTRKRLTEDTIMHVPPTLVHARADTDEKDERHGEGNDEQQQGRDVFRLERALDGDVRQGEFTLVAAYLVE